MTWKCIKGINQWFRNYCSCANTRADLETSVNPETFQNMNILERTSPPEVTARDIDNHQYEVITAQNVLELNAFLEFVIDEIIVKTEEKELTDIYCAVEKTVSHLLTKLARVEPLLESSEIVPTGSCYDGSKILELDEFDFLAIIDCLSRTNVVTVTPSKQCSAGGFAHAILKDRTAKWSRITHDNAVYAVRKPTSLREMFREHFHSVLQDEISNRFCMDMKTGSLALEGFAVAINGPQCNVRVKWRPINDRSKPLQIDIDITPAIKCCDITTVLDRTDVEYTEVYERMEQDPVFYLIPRPVPHCNYCFKIVVTTVDQKLVKHLNESHVKELKILKYLSNEILKHNFCMKKVLSSFALKMAVLHHGFECQGTNASVGECLVTTLNYIVEHLKADPPSLSSVFISSRNIWKHELQTQELSQACDALQQIIGLFEDIRDGKLKSFSYVSLREMMINYCKLSMYQG